MPDHLLSEVITPEVVSYLQQLPASLVDISVMHHTNGGHRSHFLSNHPISPAPYVDVTGGTSEFSQTAMARDAFVYMWFPSVHPNTSDAVNVSVFHNITFSHRIALSDRINHGTWGYQLRRHVLPQLLDFSICTRKGVDEWVIFVTSEEDCVIVKMMYATQLRKSSEAYCKDRLITAK